MKTCILALIGALIAFVGCSKNDQPPRLTYVVPTNAWTVTALGTNREVIVQAVNGRNLPSQFQVVRAKTVGPSDLRVGQEVRVEFAFRRNFYEIQKMEFIKAYPVGY